MHIGYIGLGKMGQNMITRLLERGHIITAYDPDAAARERAAALGTHVTDSVAAVAIALPPPRTIWLMVPHDAVDAVLEELAAQLAQGDTVIDGGNTYYKDSVRRSAEFAQKGIAFLDAGVSGGPSGARNGASVMVGGKKDVYARFEQLFSDIATDGGYGYMGESGAGHFVKMVHNGIEYGMMQAIAEGFTLMKAAPFQLDLKEVARVYNHQSVITSRLVGWLESAYEAHGTELTDISGAVAQSGEGLWTVKTAQELGVPAPIIAGAVEFRRQSQEHPSYIGKVLSALRNQFGGHTVGIAQKR